MQFDVNRPFVPREVTDDEMDKAVERMMCRWYELMKGYDEPDTNSEEPSK